MRRKMSRLACLAIVLTLLSVSTGCTDFPLLEAMTYDTYALATIDRDRYTSELWSVDESREEVIERYRRTLDLNGRILKEDWGTFWLLNEPRKGGMHVIR